MCFIFLAVKKKFYGLSSLSSLEAGAYPLINWGDRKMFIERDYEIEWNHMVIGEESFLDVPPLELDNSFAGQIMILYLSRVKDHLCVNGYYRHGDTSLVSTDSLDILLKLTIEIKKIDGEEVFNLEREQIVTVSVESNKDDQNKLMTLTGLNWTMASQTTPPIAKFSIQRSELRTINRFLLLLMELFLFYKCHREVKCN
jgi:hypothetical protein